jgi:hypothetical protein
MFRHQFRGIYDTQWHILLTVFRGAIYYIILASLPPFILESSLCISSIQVEVEGWSTHPSISGSNDSLLVSQENFGSI